MKRLFCLLMVLLLAVGLLACGQNEEETKTPETTPAPTEPEIENGIIKGDMHPYIGTKKATLNPTVEPIVVDGEMDEQYELVGTKISLDEFNLYYWGVEPQNQSAEVYMTYDKDYLYLYVEVEDDNIDYSGGPVWEKDSLGVILDFGYNRKKESYKTVGGDQIGYVNIACDESYEYYMVYLAKYYSDKIAYRSKILNGKYTIEMQLPFLVEFKGEKVGFEVINCDSQNGGRVGVRTWNIDGYEMHEYTHCTGTLEFAVNLWQ